jgi:hypothetical protein
MWIRDSRCGFSQLLPGHPCHAVEDPGPGRPACDFLVTSAELPIKVRYLLKPRPANALDPKLMAPALALVYARSRGESPGEPSPAQSQQLAGFAAEGAGSILYALQPRLEDDVDTEETLVLIRDRWVMFVSKSFAKERIDPVAWSLFNGAATQSIVWDPTRTLPIESVWPPSLFLEPGVAGNAKPGPRDAFRRALAAQQIAPAEKEGLARALRQLFGIGEPPTQPVTAEMKQTMSRYLRAACDDQRLWQIVDDGLAQVVIAYDLHGLAIVLWRELTSGR